MIWGALIGDYWGGLYEEKGLKLSDQLNFNQQSRLSDDSLLTLATAQGLLDGGTAQDFARCYRQTFLNHPSAGFGQGFAQWARQGQSFRSSWANGCVMRIAPIAHYASTLEEAFRLAKKSCQITHRHLQSFHSAMLIVGALFLWIHGQRDQQVQQWATSFWPYEWPDPCNIDPTIFDCRAIFTAPLALRCRLLGKTMELTLRYALQAGGDSDTVCATACSLCLDQPRPTLYDPVNQQLTPKDRQLISQFEQVISSKKT